MRIAIDARFYGEAGPGRYVSELLRHLEVVDQSNDYTVFLKSSNYDLYHPTNPRFRKALANFHWYTLSEQLIFPFILYKGHFDLVHFAQINVPLLYLRPFVVTVHDAILHEFSTERGSLIRRLFYRLKKIPYHLVFLKDVFQSRFIFVPSQATKDDILRYYRIKSEKIFVTYEAVDHYPSNHGAPEEVTFNKYGIRKPYILCLGSFYPHKNTRRLVEAFASLKEHHLFDGQLVLVGKESPFSQLLQNFVRERAIRDIIFPGLFHPQGYLPDGEVETILAGAYLYVQPALKEGFGIPPVEAMVFGVPVASSDIPCLREMCADAAAYFDPTSLNDMVDKLGKVVGDVTLRSEMVKKGYENIKRFSWREMANITQSVYERAVGSSYGG